MRVERRAQGRAEAALGVLFGGVLVAGAAVGALWLHLGLPRPGCHFRNLTGFPCPTCGSTRLVEALLSGDLLAAVALNPLVFFGLIAVAAWAGWSVAGLAFGLPGWRVILTSRERLGLRLLAVAALVAGWAYLIWRGV